LLPPPSSSPLRACAQLAKCDLLTGLVGEFRTAGHDGACYARHDGEPEIVAAAIAEQYLPRYAGDALPARGVGAALALADKLDTIVGIFAIGQKPSGRAIHLGFAGGARLLRIAQELEIELDLVENISLALGAVTADIAAVQATRSAAPAGPVPANVAGEIYDYVMERLRAQVSRGRRRGHARDVRCRPRPETPLAARFWRATEGARGIPAPAGRRRARGRQQAHREHPAQGGRARRNVPVVTLSGSARRSARAALERDDRASKAYSHDAITPAHCAS